MMVGWLPPLRHRSNQPPRRFDAEMAREWPVWGAAGTTWTASATRRQAERRSAAAEHLQGRPSMRSGRAVRGVDAELAREQGMHGTACDACGMMAEADVDSRGQEVEARTTALALRLRLAIYGTSYQPAEPPNQLAGSSTTLRRRGPEPKLDPWRREPVFSALITEAPLMGALRPSATAPNGCGSTVAAAAKLLERTAPTQGLGAY